MRIVGVDVGGFGRLRGLSLEFSPGFNLIVGPNEEGKSTLLEAMQGLLFGLAEEGGTTGGETPSALANHFRPWFAGQFGGALRVALANGDQFQIVRDFERGIGRIYREPGAVDVTVSYSQPRSAGHSFADVHLNLTRAVFRASAWIDQADIQLGGDDVASIKGKLERLADSAGIEATASEALDRLEGLLRARIAPRGYPPVRGPLLQTRDDVERLGSDLSESRRVYGGLDAAAVEERTLATHLAALTEQLARLEAQHAWRELTDLEDRILRWNEIEGALGATRARLARFFP